MKKILSIVFAVIMVLSLSACGSKTRTETENITVDGMYVDANYKDKDGLKLLYVVFDIDAKQNLEIDSKYMELTVDDTNEYESEVYSDACKYIENLYYSAFIEDLYSGDTIKLVTTFKVTESDLEVGKTLKLSDYQIPEVEQLLLKTDDIVSVDGEEALAEIIDPDGLKKIKDMKKTADSTTTERVRSSLNGYYFSFYASPASYRLEFFAPDKFTIDSTIGGSTVSNSGTYTVTNGYVSLYYPSNGYTVDIPYEFNDSGDIVLVTGEAFGTQ